MAGVENNNNEDIINNNVTDRSRHPMMTRRRSGLYNIFEGIPEEQIINLRKKFQNRGPSSKSKDSNKEEGENGVGDDAQNRLLSRRRRSETLDDITSEEPTRMPHRKSGKKDSVSSGRVTKTSGRQRRVGVVTAPKLSLDSSTEETDVQNGEKAPE